MRKMKLIAMAASALVLVGCESAPESARLATAVPQPGAPQAVTPPQPSPQSGQQTAPPSPQGELDVRVLITPHLGTTWKGRTASTGIWDDVYTRIRIGAQDLPGHMGTASGTQTPRKYSDEARNKFLRLIAGRSVAAGLTLKVSLTGNAPDFEAVVPVVALSHESTSDKGEAWSTDVVIHSLDRLVRVRPGSKLHIQAEVSRTRETSSQAVRAALNITREATKVLVPQSGALTALSANSAEREARLWDATIGKLFSFSLSEKATADALLSEMAADEPRMTVKLSLPRDLSEYDPDFNVGTWDISLDCPTRSLFLIARRETEKQNGKDTVVCRSPGIPTVPLADVSPERVLNYPLLPGTTVLSHLRSLRSFSDSMQDLAAATTDATRVPHASRVCSTILEEMDRIGLTVLDGRLVLWSVSARSPDTVRKALASACSDDLAKLVSTLRELGVAAP